MAKITKSALRVGGTSWVVEGNLAENLRHLSSEVSDMEIVLFDTDSHTNMPSPCEVLELRELCRELGMTCTVHFPADICSSPCENERVQAEELCLRTAELFAPLDPFAWILHITGDKRGGIPSLDMDRWALAGMRSAARIASHINDRHKLCIENLDYDLSLVEGIVSEHGLSICLDIGHLIKCAYPVAGNMARYMDRTRVLHVHGVMPDGTDHVALSHLDTGLLAEVIGKSDDGRERVMTMEVFNEDYEISLNVLRSMNILSLR